MLKIAIDTTMMDGRQAKGTALVIKKHIENLVNYQTTFDITLVHKHHQSNEPLYSSFKEIIIPRVWNGPFGGVINEFLFFSNFWLKVFFGKQKLFDVYFVAYSRILPTFVLAPAKKFVFYPMDGGPLTAGLTLNKVKTPFPKYVIWFKKRIARFLALSKFGQRGIVNLLSIKKDIVPIVPAGVNNLFFEKTITETDVRAIKQKYHFPEKYILCVSRWDPHKNILSTIEAYALYRQQVVNPLPLLFVGGKHLPDYSAKVDEKIAALKLNDHILVSKFVEEEDLPAVYAGAEFLIFASYYEGFGLPVIEAMAAGCPVICSNNSSLVEVGGEAAMKVDPYDIGAITTALVVLHDNTALKQQMVEKGLVWSKQFTWANAVKQLVLIFKDLEKEIYGLPSRHELCPLCNKVGEHKYLWSHFDDIGGETTFDLFLCRLCGVEHWSPMKNPGSEWYERDERYANRNIDPTVIPGLQHILAVKQMKSHVGSILDVGCGNGNFLAHAFKYGFTGEGFDFDRDGIESGRRTFNIPELYVDDLSGWLAKHSDRRYDWVTFFDVFEHIDNHNEFIGQVKSLLKPEGRIAFSIPHSRGTRFIMTGDVPPRHLTRWSPEAIKLFLEGRGFAVERIAFIAAPFHQVMLKIKWRYGRLFSFGLVGKVKKQLAKETYKNEQGHISYIPKKSAKVATIHLLAKAKDYLLFGLPALVIWLYLLPQNKRYTDMVIFAKKVDG